MTTLSVAIDALLVENAKNEVMIDALFQWANNPTSMTAGWGLERLYPCIAKNLNLRYKLSSEEVNVQVQELRETCDRLIDIAEGDAVEPKRQVGYVQDLIATGIRLGETGIILRQGVLRRLEDVSEDIRLFLLFSQLVGSITEYFIDLNYLRPRAGDHTDSQAKFEAYCQVVFGRTISANNAVQGAIQSGTHNDLYWIPSSKASSRPDYTLVQAITPTVEELEALGVNLPVVPDLNTAFSAWRQENDFAILRLVDMVSHSYQGITSSNELLPANIDQPGLLGKRGQLVAVSPIIRDAMRLGIDETKFQLTDFNRTKVEAALRQTSQDADPDCYVEVPFSRSTGETLWALRHPTKPTLFVYFAPWLTVPSIENDLRGKLGRNVHLLVVVPYQTPSSILNTIEQSRLSQYVESLSLLSTLETPTDVRSIKGERHQQISHFIDALNGVEKVSGEGPRRRGEERKKKILEPRIEPKDADSILVGGRDFSGAGADPGLLGWADDTAAVYLDMFVGRTEHEERAHAISLFGVQSTGKSYTVGAILEMALVPQDGIREGPAMPAVVFHYDQNVVYKPEAANLAYPSNNQDDIEVLQSKLGVIPKGVDEVVILVPPWRVDDRTKEFPDAEVKPLVFSSNELDIPQWSLLMGIPGSSALYVRLMKELFLQLVETVGNITVATIGEVIRQSSMAANHKRLAELRLAIAERWIDDRYPLGGHLKPGRLVILDIRDEMIEVNQAMELCLISLGVIQKAKTPDGSPMPKLIVLDEAHKYVKNQFAAEIDTVVSEMRHTATTVVIASQSPNSIPQSVLEKSSAVILHQLTSPAQVRYVKRAVQGLSGLNEKDVTDLQKGHAIIWARESTGQRVMDSGIVVNIRPRFTRHTSE